MKITCLRGIMGNTSTAITRPCGPIAAATTWLQPPGAAPRSMTVIPGFMICSRALISMSLKTARERTPPCLANLTYGSEECSLSHLELLDRLLIDWIETLCQKA